MNEFLKVAMNSRKLKAVCGELTTVQLEYLLDNLKAIVAGRHITDSAEQKANDERMRILAEYRKLIEDAGIDISELITGEDDNRIVKKNKSSLKPKYRYNVNGVEKTWSGRGRMPRVIVNALNDGHTLADFAI